MKKDQYNPNKIEKKWQKVWKDKKLYKTKESADKQKYYVLDMFPYPSGAGLHVGHPKGYIATDVVARMKMMRGFNVLHPMGWDAFGLPAENYALKNKVHPAVATKKNIQVFKKQLGLLGFTYDWDREVNTTDPNYYKWTQWIFLQMFKRGLAYESYEPINWCPSCKTGLANEDLEDGKCERCGSIVEQKPMRQWVLKITDYAERLLKDLDLLDKWPEPIKEMQRNWIGRSEGATVTFNVIARSEERATRQSSGTAFEVFTTRPDTLFGATYVVVAPEHPLISNIQYLISNINEANKYIQKAKNKTVLERTELQKEKTGVEIKGVKAINPVNNEELPIFVADYVLGNYGTGAIMAVPAHDERDFEFAKKYNLPIREVVQPLATKIEGEDAFQNDASISERNAVVCVVKHWSEDKYLGVHWTRTNWRGFVIGGIEKGESLPIAGAREVTEETGFKNLEFIGNLGNTVNARFFQLVKGENRLAHFTPMLFKLKDGEQIEVDEKEGALHKLSWLTKEEMDRFVTHADMKIIWKRVCGDLCFTVDGISIDDGVAVTGLLVNSGFLNDLEVPEAKEKMIQWLEENGWGRKTVNYKLRDWVFSRQRYWGEPIPLVHCERCAGENTKISSVFIFHAIGGSNKDHWHPWLDKELERNGIKSITPDLPNTDNPVLEEWLEVANKFYGKEFNENSVVVGRSLGARAALKFAESHKLKKLILLCPTLDGGKKYWKEIAKQVPGFPVEADQKCNAVPIDYKKVEKNVEEIVFLFSHNDPYIRREFEEHYRKNFPKARFIIYEKAGHFGAKDGFSTFPDLLDIIKPQNPGWIPVPEKNLPLELPKVKHYEPSGTGESPLANIKEWVNTKCPQCRGPAKRETNTMPQWAGSCWYYLAYVMQGISNFQFPISNYRKAFEYWNPVDLYVGGAEHATRHLIYARFWHKFLYDIGAVSNIEPFTKLQNVGLILAEDGRKMSKRWNNVINPDDVVKQFGADAMRLYEMFMGPFDQPCAWSTQGVVGMSRFLERVWSLANNVIPTKSAQGGRVEGSLLSAPDFALERDSSAPPPAGGSARNDSAVTLNQTIKKVTEDIEALRFNTAISQLMILTNEMSRDTYHPSAGSGQAVSRITYQILLQLLSPFAPHITEELWGQLGNKKSIFLSDWPKYDASKLQFDTMKLAVQVNGRVRAEIEVATGDSEEQIKSSALADENVKKWLEGKVPKKIIYVSGRLVSIVV